MRSAFTSSRGSYFAQIGADQSGVWYSEEAGTPATQTGRLEGELRGRERFKRPTIIACASDAEHNGAE
jgi:hypothetical protein